MESTKTMKNGDYVKWSNNDSVIVAMIASIKDSIAEVKLPSDQMASVGIDKLSLITEAEFKTSIASLIESLSSKIDFKSKDTIAMSTELELAKAEVAKLQADLAAKAKADVELEASMANLKKDLAASKAEVAAMQKAETAKARFEVLNKLNATASFGKDEKEILAKLSEISDETFNYVKASAEAAETKLKAAVEDAMAKKADPKKDEAMCEKDAKAAEAKAIEDAKLEAAKVLAAAALADKPDPATLANADAKAATDTILSNFISKNMKLRTVKTSTAAK